MVDTGEKISIALSVICGIIAALNYYFFSGVTFVTQPSLWEIVGYCIASSCAFLIIFITILLWIRYISSIIHSLMKSR